MRKKKVKQKLALLLSMALVVSSVAVPSKTVSAAGVSEPKSIILNVDSQESMYVGMSKKIKVKSVKPKNGSKKVTYESSDPEVVKVSSGGTMKALTEGEAIITVTSAVSEDVFKEVEVNVKNLVKNKTYNKMVIPLDKKNKTRKMSRTSKVKATYLKLSSSRKKVATVSKAGVLTGKKVGTTKITIKGKKGLVKGAKQVITLYVAKKSVESVELDKTSVTLEPNNSIKLTTTITPKDAANVVVFTSSDEDVAVVDQKGNVKAVEKGTAEITATTVDGNKEAVCVVTVGSGTTEKQTDGTTEGKPGSTTENKTEATTGEKPGSTTENKTEATTGEKPGSTTENKTEATTGEKPGTTTEDKTEATTGEKPGSTTENKTEATTGENTGSTTENKTEATTGENTGGTTENKTEATTEKESSEATTEKPTQPDTTEEITYSAPVTVEQLEAKFPAETNYPSLNLKDDYTMEVNLKDDLFSLDVEAGTIVKTKGYYAENDGGQAVYEIMTYDDWWNQLPIELKMVHYHADRIGANHVFYKNPADNYGNHRLDNGMVAKLLPNEDGYVRVEQWGLFQGRNDNNRALIHIFANNHQNSKILFGKDAQYTLYFDTKNQAYQNQNGLIDEVPWWLKPESIGNTGNEYAVMLHCRQTSKPVLGDAQNVELCGNGCTIRIPDNEFCKENAADFAMIETGGYVDGLTIHGFTFDSNGLNQYQYYDNSKEEYVQMRTTNHTISYFSGSFNVGLGDKESITAVTDGNGKQVMDTTWAEVKNYNKRDKMCFNNVEIYGNTFLANGTSVDTPDGGGDDILIINPEESNNVNIHNNKMYNWGRWVFAVDLGGNGERFYNYTFKQNICIQDESNVTRSVSGETATPTHANRGLGWIDFEARKCFTNLDVSENYVYGINGWAFNGNGKISENITINANTIERPSYSWKSAYPYAFSFYSVYAKDLKLTNNKLGSGGIDWGGLAYNMRIENNDMGTASFGIKRPLGTVIVKDNVGEGTRNQSYNIQAPADLPWIDDETSEFYVAPEDRKTYVLFENNKTGGVVSDIVVDGDETDYRRNMTLDFKDNIFYKFDIVAWGVKDVKFTIDQIQAAEGYNVDTWLAKGAKSIPIESLSINPVPGGVYYKEGDLISTNISERTYGRLGYLPAYFSTLFPEWLEYTPDKEKHADMYCVKEGVFPISGGFLNCDSDLYFTAGTEYKAGQFVYTADNMYYVKTTGTAGTEEPTHTSGTVKNGTAELLWIAPIARYEMREK